MSRRKKGALRRIVRIALFVAMALIMFFVESAFPPLLVFAPGAKMGLANVITLVALIVLGAFDAAVVVVIRCLLASLYGGVSTLMYSFPAALTSYAVMLLLYKTVFPWISIVSISFFGAIVHNVSQLLVAAVVVKNFSILGMLPFMLVASIIAGIFVGLVSHYVVKAIPTSIYLRE